MMYRKKFSSRKYVSYLITVIFLCIIISLFSCGGCGGGGGSSTDTNGGGSSNSATLTWDAPTTNADGTPLTDLAGYKIYWSEESGNFNSNNSITVGKDVTTYTLENLHFSPGTYYFTVTAYDTEGNESDYAKQVTKIID